MKTHVLVTGGAGFIGSHLCEKLLDEGYLVTCLDNFDEYYPKVFKLNNINNAAQNPRFRLVEGDILDENLVRNLLTSAMDDFEPPAVVIHLAALAGVRPSIDSPARYARVNVEGTAILLEEARKSSVAQFIFGSTSAVYGDSAQIPFKESDAVGHPLSPYAATKRSAELVCWTCHILHNLPITVLRFFTVYGPRQRPDMAIHKFTRLISEGNEISMYGDGESARDYTYVCDIVNGILGAVRYPVGYEVINLGGAQPVKLRDLITSLGTVLGSKVKIKKHPDQQGDVAITSADITKAERLLSYRPETELFKGLKYFWDWFREYDRK